MYPSVPLLLVTWLQTQFPTARVSTDLPADLSDQLPVIHVRRFGGADDVITMDRANCDVDVWHTDLTSADELARLVRVALRVQLPGTTVTAVGTTGTFAKVDTVSAPSERPATDRGSRGSALAVGVDVRRVGASYRFAVHSH